MESSLNQPPKHHSSSVLGSSSSDSPLVNLSFQNKASAITILSLPLEVHCLIADWLPPHYLKCFLALCRQLRANLFGPSGISYHELDAIESGSFLQLKSFQNVKRLQIMANGRADQAAFISLPSSLNSLSIKGSFMPNPKSSCIFPFDFNQHFPFLSSLVLSNPQLTCSNLFNFPESLTDLTIKSHLVDDTIISLLPKSLIKLHLGCFNHTSCLGKLPAAITHLHIELHGDLVRYLESKRRIEVPIEEIPIEFASKPLETLIICHAPRLSRWENLPSTLRHFHLASESCDNHNFPSNYPYNLQQLTHLGLPGGIPWIDLPLSLTSLVTSHLASPTEHHKLSPFMKLPSTVQVLEYHGDISDISFFESISTSLTRLNITNSYFPSKYLKHLPHTLIQLSSSFSHNFGEYIQDLPPNVVVLSIPKFSSPQGSSIGTALTFHQLRKRPKSIKLFTTPNIEVDLKTGRNLAGRMEDRQVLAWHSDHWNSPDTPLMEMILDCLDPSKIIRATHLVLPSGPTCLSIVPKSLTHLAIRDSGPWTDESLQGLPENLTYLYLYPDDKLTDRALTFLPSSITEVKFPLSKQFSIKLFELAPPSLKKLSIGQLRLTNELAAYFDRKSSTTVNYQSFVDTAIGLIELHKRENGLKLDVSRMRGWVTSLNDGLSEFIAPNKSIKILELEGDFTNSFLCNLPKKLEKLALLTSSLITDAGISNLSQSKCCETLKSIRIPCASLNTVCVHFLPPNLEELVVSNMCLDGQLLKNWQSSLKPNLQSDEK